MIKRGQNFKEIPINICGSSVFGRYPKISVEKTYNMFVSDTFLVDYAGYEIAIPFNSLRNGKTGRGIFTSTKFNRLVTVIDNNVFLISLNFIQQTDKSQYPIISLIGQLQTYSGVVYITENNKPQILISDNEFLYIYDTTASPSFQLVPGLNFTPGYVTFHETYFLCAASQDNTYSPPANNTWRLSLQNEGLTPTSGYSTAWPSDAQHVGLIQTKPDNTQAVVRFPSKGNMIFVMGSIVTEAWNFTAAQLFPYQRQNQFNIDYGCISAATVAYMDEIVVWLAQNEKSGPIIMYSNGGMPQKITTDGIDFLFSQLQNPQDSQAFLYRQDGHLFYHINFYSDNLSLFCDFLPDGTQKFYHAGDQNLNYFIAAEIAFYKNQYYFVSRNTGNLYAFDTSFTSYQDTDSLGNIQYFEIPRIRTCRNIRAPTQDYFILNDLGFTIETGETDYQQQSIGYFNLVTQDKMQLITQQGVTEPILIQSQDANYYITQSGAFLSLQQTNQTDNQELVGNQMNIIYTTPVVDFSLSYDGGATFSRGFRYELNPIGQRRNRLLWWQGGITNDAVPEFRFSGFGRFVCTDGIANIRF